MERKTSKAVLGTHHHQKTQGGENEAESKRQPKPVERVLLVDKPYQSKKKVKPVEKPIKQPKRGLGVAKLEILRLEGKLKHMSEQLVQLQAEKEFTVAAAAAVPPPHNLPPLLPRPPQHQRHHHQQFQAPFPPFVDPRQQYPNGMIPVPNGRFVPVGNFPAAAGAMNKDGPHPHPMNFVFQPMNQNGGYPGPGEPMNVIPSGGFPTGNGGGFIPAGHHHHEPNLNINGNGGESPAGHHHESNTNMNGNGGPAAHHHHHEPNNNIIMNGNGGGFPVVGGEVNNGGYSNQNIAADNPYMFLDQQLRIQHLKLLHSARELSAIQRMQYRAPRPSKFSVQMNPAINIEEPISKDKMVMNDTVDFLELSLGSTTNIDEKIKIDDVEITQKVVEVDPFGAGRRRSTSSSVVMEYEFFPAESSDNRSSSYSGGGGGGGMGGNSEASTSNENTHLVDLSLKLSL